MIRFALGCLLLLLSLGSYAEEDSSHLRVSLITCGPGEEVWETFGHTALRVTDSLHGTDDVYNYGTFAFSDDFLIKFTRGKLLYSLSFYPYRDFLPEYIEAHRSVQEQVLLLSGEKKQQIFDYLQWNARPENRDYKYDFFFDNCATRIRDVFPRSLGPAFHFAPVLPAGHPLSYRNIINQYFYRVHWQRFGVNILLGSRIDKIMTNEEIMFLPDYLRDGIAGANLKGQSVSTAPGLLIPGASPEPAGVNGPFLLMVFVALLTLAGFSVPRLRKLGGFMTWLLLFVSGFIGCFILVMWLGTDHQACQNNFNLLWALPTNIFLAFAPKKRKGRYAAVAIILLLTSLLLHLLKVQELPLLELSPLLLSLLAVYGMIYRKNTINN